MNAGIIVAAGKGERYGSYKQTEILLNKKVYQHSLDIFLNSDSIQDIYLVVHEDIYNLIEKDFEAYPHSKPIFLCKGGETRAISVYNAIRQLTYTESLDLGDMFSKKYDKVCIHDAVRPLITKKDIENVLLNCPHDGGCIVGTQIYDTIKNVKKNKIVKTVDRNDMWLSQTPQAFCLGTLRNCYAPGFTDATKNNDKKSTKRRRTAEAYGPLTSKLPPSLWVDPFSFLTDRCDNKEDSFSDFTDEATLLESKGYNVKIIESTNTNIKITDKKDLELAKQLLPNNIAGVGIDFHSLVAGDYLIIGGHKVECQLSSKAHSDGDVLTHSIIDALLGALNLGDIGEHFPNTPEYLDISSIELLKKVVQKIPSNKKILHIDTSIVLNEPKISPHKEAIKKSLSNVLGISADKISIKSTTTNGLAFLDMSKGWGAQTVLTLGNES